MALVAYDNSDSSEYEDEDSENTTVVLNNPLEAKSSLKLPEPVQKQVAIQSQEENQESSSATLFNLLPQPSIKKPVVIEENDEYLLKKENANVNKPKAKITVPSLNDFKDVDTNTPIAKLKAHNKKTSGLLSLLPQPRNGVKATTKSLIPNILKTKPVSAKKEPLPSSLKNVKFNAAPVINDYSDDSDPEEVQNDFFAMNKPVCISTDADMSLEIEQYAVAQASNNTQKPRGIESFFKKDDLTHMQLHGDYGNDDIQDEAEASSTYNLNIAEENSNSNEGALDEEAILKLCGARGKRKREQIQIVDVNQEEVLADARKMLLKGLMDDTTKRVSASKKKGNEPTTQQRRKHQITYLAYQAKANEAELQNQWANNRMSKKQTQAKYGF